MRSRRIELPPYILVDALNDRIHSTSGKLIKSTPIKTKFNNILLLEILDSRFETLRDKNLENLLNSHLEDKIYPEYTTYSYSEHMKQHGLGVLKLKNRKNNMIEYHLHSNVIEPGYKQDDVNQKPILHSLKIIHDDVQKHLKLGHKIKIQSASSKQHKIYKSFIKYLIRNHKNRKFTDVGETPRLDGSGYSSTYIIEDKHFGSTNFNKILTKINELHFTFRDTRF